MLWYKQNLREFLLHLEPAYDKSRRVKIVGSEYKALHRLKKILQLLGSDNAKGVDNAE
jgi:hypothetical protein